MVELKNCPFCGCEAKLVRTAKGYACSPSTTILDDWRVQCTNIYCTVYTSGQSKIYQNDDGEIVVDANGAEIAVEKWNMRGGIQ